MDLYELRYYKNQYLYKCCIPANSTEDAIKKLQDQSPEVKEFNIKSIINLDKISINERMSL